MGGYLDTKSKPAGCYWKMPARCNEGNLGIVPGFYNNKKKWVTKLQFYGLTWKFKKPKSELSCLNHLCGYFSKPLTKMWLERVEEKLDYSLPIGFKYKHGQRRYAVVNDNIQVRPDTLIRVGRNTLEVGYDS